MSFFAEIRRRKVFQVAAVYAVVAWLLIQIVATVAEPLGLPGWFDTAVIVFLAVGFPVAIILSWAFDLTPAGVERTGYSDETMPAKTGPALNVTVIGALAVLVALVGLYVFTRGDTITATSNIEDHRSIAVLPFANRSTRPEDLSFVDGIHDDILTQLARISSLKVISRTSVMSYRDTDKNMRTIGDELGVATILEGGVQRAGDTVRINVQLIDAATDEHLWAETYDRELTMGNLFAIQSEMAGAIANALEVTLSPDEISRLAAVPTTNRRAYDFYLSGKNYLRSPDNVNGSRLAEEMFERAVSEDPGFALGWAALGHARSRVFFFSNANTGTTIEAAKEAIDQAFRIDPDLPEAHLALGYYWQYGFRDYDEALRQFAIAEHGLPQDSELFLGRAFTYRRMGRWQEALENFDRAVELDPRNLDALGGQYATRAMLRDYEGAQRFNEQMREIFPDEPQTYADSLLIVAWSTGDFSQLLAGLDNSPMELGGIEQQLGYQAALQERNYDRALQYLDEVADEVVLVSNAQFILTAAAYGVVHQLAGRGELARRYFQTANDQLAPRVAADPDAASLQVAMGEILVGLGQPDEAVSMARRALSLLPKSRDAFQGHALQIDAIQRVFGPAGDGEAVVEQLEDYLTAPGFVSIEGILPDPRLDPVRKDPRFAALVEKYRRR